MIKVLAIIPHYNHPDTVGFVVASMRQLGIDCVIIDDGSSEQARDALRGLEAQGYRVFYRQQNGGKGAAVKDGLRYAQEAGYSHALQVDADAQHHLDDSVHLMQLAQQHPQAVICAQPIYGDDAPKSRLYGRKLSNFWIAINTLSLDIKDGMCGFRIYPVATTNQVIAQHKVGNFMDFDIDILVRLHHQGLEFKWRPTAVKYEQGGVSHFRAWRDNVLISRMHARLFFAMLGHLPSIVQQRLRRLI